MIRRVFTPLAFALALFASAPSLAQDAADIVVRLNRLENQMRQSAGEIERLQFENRQLREQLRKFQEDVEFRFQESGGRGGAGAAPRPAQSPPPATPPGRRSDAFDPSTTPAAPGAPRPLGQTTPSAPLPGGAIAGIIEQDEAGSGPLDLNAVGRGPAGQPPARPSIAATGSGDARADYETAYAYVLQKQYEQAEMGFRQFLQSHPRDRLVPDAIFWLGETYFQRNRHREAAEQFLKISTDHSRAAKAPDAMLKLGISLAALGARDQACATFAELGRKYPTAANTVRQGVEREQRRARCTA
jgi:tol-pal system protein YbgF